MLRLRPGPALAAAALTLLPLAACGSDSPLPTADETTTTAAETTTTTEAETTTTTETPDSTATTAGDAGDGSDDEGIDEIESLAQSLLVEAGEVSTDTLTFEDSGYTPPDADRPNACGAPSTDSVVPPQVLVGTSLTEPASTLVFQEEIRVYVDEAEAGEAFAAGVEALSCGTSIDGTVTIDGPTDVAEEVGGDEAVAFAVRAEAIEGVLVVVRVSDAVVLFLFTAPPGVAAEILAPDPLEVSAFGIGKILAALGE
ncbi:MAG: hypothetical protein H0W25_10265 [Acidimicrobiia bacterium]|nr:hypothetical protein [Acidimicrobiia bacterium]